MGGPEVCLDDRSGGKWVKDWDWLRIHFLEQSGGKWALFPRLNPGEFPVSMMIETVLSHRVREKPRKHLVRVDQLRGTRTCLDDRSGV